MFQRHSSNFNEPDFSWAQPTGHVTGPAHGPERANFTGSCRARLNSKFLKRSRPTAHVMDSGPGLERVGLGLLVATSSYDH